MIKQSGIAIISALLIVALVSVAAVSMSSRQQLDIRRTGNLLHSEQAWAYVLGAESWAQVVLMKDRKANTIDSLDEDWSTTPPISSVEGGNVIGRIMDMEGRFNVNNIITPHGKVHEPARDQYKRLLLVLDLDVTLVDALIDWLDSNVSTRFPDGAEDDTYLLKDQPYRAANRRMSDISELQLVHGYDREIFKKLEPYVIALPEATSINVNTASAIVLRIVAEGISDIDAESLIAARDSEAFETEHLFIAESAVKGKSGVDVSTLSVSSEWFQLVSEANIGNGKARLASLINRTGTKTLVVRRKRNFSDSVLAPETN